MGGVYVPVTKETPSNPYLEMPQRDIPTHSGTVLTLINPAYMTRQVHELAAKAYGIYSHITSLNPIRSANAPDPWETQALQAFQRGVKESGSVEEMKGEAYMRFMQPLITEKSCLKCHAAQGYKVGDIRGGISVSVSMSPLWAIEQLHIITLSLGHGLIWLVGLAGLGLGTRCLSKQIIEREKAEEATIRAKKEWELTFDAVSDFIMIVDESFRIVRVNKAMADMLGVPPDKAIGLICYEQVHGTQEPPSFCPHAKLLADGQNHSAEIYEERLGGNFMVSASPLKDAKSHLTGSVHVVYDITKRVKAEEELKQYRDYLEEMVKERTAELRQEISERKQAEKEREKLQEQLFQSKKMEAIGSLAGGIAHEFNNILTTIIGNTHLAIAGIPERNPARDCLQEIQSASLRAKDVVRRLLGFARKSVFQLQPVHLSSIIRDAMILIRASTPATIEIRQNLSCESDTVMADSSQIDLVFLNLCANAKNAMQEKGGMLEVKLENTTLDEKSAIQYEDLGPGNYIKMTVRDTGHGIDSKIIDRIFEPYFTTCSLAEATGMGLAVVHGIVKRHNGAIIVESEPGKGTVFEVLFPLTETEAEQGAGEPEALPTGNEKILFVDDEASLVKMAKRSLEMQGYQVEAKSDSVEALELFRSKPDQFDLIITDMTMPKMTGDKLAKEILSIRPDTPIILCSGFSEKIDEEKAAALGICKYIEKPLNMSDFVMAVRKVLDEAQGSTHD